MRVIFSCWRQWSSGWPFSQGASIDCALFWTLANYAVGLFRGISLEMPVCMHTREGPIPPPLPPLSPRKDGHWCTHLARPSTSSSVQCWAVHPIFMSRLWSHLFNRNIVVFLKGHALWWLSWLIQFCSDLLTVGATLELWFCCPPILPSPSPVLVALVHLNLINIYI